MKRTIFIVDDDIDDREIIRDAFMTAPNENHEYSFIENGGKLIDLLQQCAADAMPDLIILDLNMPGKDGREALREIKADAAFRKIPTIVFTTSSSYRDRDVAYHLGANCFVTKPDTFTKLVELANSISRLWLPKPS